MNKKNHHVYVFVINAGYSCFDGEGGVQRRPTVSEPEGDSRLMANEDSIQ